MSPARRPIRVLLVAQPLDAGVPRHVLDIVDELGGDATFALTVACPPSSMLWDRLAETPAVRLRRFTARRAPHPGDLLWLVRLAPLVWRSDVVHAHSSKASWLARATALLLGRRSSCVVTPHAWSFWAFTGRRAPSAGGPGAVGGAGVRRHRRGERARARRGAPHARGAHGAVPRHPQRRRHRAMARRARSRPRPRPHGRPPRAAEAAGARHPRALRGAPGEAVAAPRPGRFRRARGRVAEAG